MADHATQANRILDLLKRHEGKFVPLPEILKLFIANYRARISDLRPELWKQGYEIQLRDERVNGERHTAYRLVRRVRPQQLMLAEQGEARP